MGAWARGALEAQVRPLEAGGGGVWGPGLGDWLGAGGGCSHPGETWLRLGLGGGPGGGGSGWTRGILKVEPLGLVDSEDVCEV